MPNCIPPIVTTDSKRSLVNKTAMSFSEQGPLKTIGKVSKFLGDTINYNCYSANQKLNWIRQGEYPLDVRIEATKYGLSPYSYVWFGLHKKNPDQYLTDRDFFRTVNRTYINTLHNKYVFYTMTKPYIDALPRLFGMLVDGQYRHPPTGSPYIDLITLLDSEERVVLKPIRGESGKGVFLLEKTKIGYKLNGDQKRESELLYILENLSDYLIKEFVQQHIYVDSVFPNATNTLRVYSVIDPQTGEPDVIRAAHRFGSEESAPVDNWDRGGYCAPVDIDTGRVMDLVVLDSFSRRSRCSHHPDTGEKISGLAVPYWDDVREIVVRAADLHRGAPMVGWDVLVSEDKPVIIEGNPVPGIHLLQIEEGIFEDERVAALSAR